MSRKEKCRAKRLRSNKGSVLFFIVAIMSILVIIASAAYYAVNSAGKQVEVRRDSEQSYQSAVALVDLVSDFMEAKPNDAFVTEIVKLDPNKTLVTKSDDGSTFSPIAAGLGNYKITVEKVSVEGTKHIVKITAEVEVDGATSILTAVGQLTEGTSQSEGMKFDKFFASTGYTSNDVIMRGVQDMSEAVYMDNEYVEIGTTGYDNNKPNIGNDITVAGTLKFNNITVDPTDKGLEIVVGNNFFLEFDAGALQLGKAGGNKGSFKVGGNLYHKNGDFGSTTKLYVLGDMIGSPNNSTEADVYVNGDFFYLRGEGKGYAAKYKTLYINGDLYIGDDAGLPIVETGTLAVGGNVYINTNTPSASWQVSQLETKLNDKGIGNDQIVYYASSGQSADETYFYDQRYTPDEYADKAELVRVLTGHVKTLDGLVWPEGVTPSDIASQINAKLTSPVYKLWDLNDEFFDASGNLKPEVTKLKYEFASVEPDWDAIHAQQTAGGENYGKLSGTKFLVTVSAEEFGNYIYYDSITASTSISDEDKAKGRAIIFDTRKADGTSVDMKVYLPANCIKKDDGTFSTTLSAGETYDHFTWLPVRNDTALSIFVLGEGSVTFFIAPNTTYSGASNQVVSHMNLYQELTGGKGIKDGFVDGWGYEQIPKNSADIRSILFYDEKQIIKESVIRKYKDIGAIHNNLFLVSIDKASRVDVGAQNHLFCGFVYCPFSTFDLSAPGYGLKMLGGVIASDYAMLSTSNCYVMTIPYDYYYRCTDKGSLTEDELLDPDLNYEKRKDYINSIVGSEYDDINATSKRSWKRFGYN